MLLNKSRNRDAVAIVCIFTNAGKIQILLCKFINFFLALSLSTENLVTDVSNFYTVIVLPAQLQPCSEETENIGSEFKWLTTLTVFFLQ